MHKVTKMRLLDLNEHLVCALCRGYLVDATTIVECLHSFCRSCLLRHLDNSTQCPVCDKVIHKARPHKALRSDKALQGCVYKLVPGLFRREMERRRRFYSNYPADAALLSPEKRGEVTESMCADETAAIVAPISAAALVRSDERVSVSLEFADCSRLVKRALHPEALDSTRVCYLLCPACCTIAQLVKFLTLKLDLQPHFEVSIFYTDDVLTGDYTLMDVAYVYSWRRRNPLRLFYTVVDPSVEPLNSNNLPLLFNKHIKTEGDEDDAGDEDEDNNDVASDEET